MNLFENAITFFHNCESAKGWESCKDYVAENAGFIAQSEALKGVTTVKEYVDWIFGLSTITMPGCTYNISAQGFDEEKIRPSFSPHLRELILGRAESFHQQIRQQIRQQIHTMYMLYK